MWQNNFQLLNANISSFVVVGIDSRRKHGTGSKLLCGLANAEGCEKEEDGF